MKLLNFEIYLQQTPEHNARWLIYNTNVSFENEKLYDTFDNISNS